MYSLTPTFMIHVLIFRPLIFLLASNYFDTQAAESFGKNVPKTQKKFLPKKNAEYKYM